MSMFPKKIKKIASEESFAFQEGFKAGREQARPENPYNYDTETEQYCEWEEGYCSGHPNKLYSPTR